MATPNNRNAISEGAAGAESQNTGATRAGLTPGDGPVDVSALANALAAFEGQGGNENNDQGQPGGETPGGLTQTGQLGEETENLDDPNQPLPEEGAEPEAGGDGAELQNEPGAGETPEGEQPEPGGEGEPEGEPELPATLRKRIGRLLTKIHDLETELGKRPAQESGASAPRPTALDSVTDLNELLQREASAEEVLAEIDPHIARLAFAPQRVEKYLRDSKIVLKDENGNEDYSVERMADLLLSVKSENQAVLKAVPGRRTWLQNHAQAHAQVLKVKPWVGDASDERHAEMQQILRQFPSLKGAPNYEYWLACAIEGHRATQASLKRNGANGNGAARTPRPTNGVRRGMPASGAAGGGGPRVAPNVKKIQEAKARAMKQGTVGALTSYLEAAA